MIGGYPILTSDWCSLPCGHVFHAACVRLHVASRYDCPVCHCPASVASLASLQLSCVASPGDTWHMNPHHNIHNAAECPFEMFKIPKPINTA